MKSKKSNDGENAKFVLEIICEYLDDLDNIKKQDALPANYLQDIYDLHLNRISYFCRRYNLKTYPFQEYYIRKTLNIL